MRQNSNSNTQQIHRAVLTGFLMVASIILARFAFMNGTPVFGLAIPGILIVSLLLERPWLIFICVLAASEAMVRIPGFPDALGGREVFEIFLIGWAVLDIAMRKRKACFSYDTSIDVWMVLFFINVIFIMAVTGVGFRVQGQSSYGGSVYLGLLAAIGFYFSAVKLTFTEKQLKIMIWGVLVAAAIPAGLQFVVYFNPAMEPLLTRYITINTEYFMLEQAGPSDAVRWNQLSGFSFALVTVAYVLCKQRTIRAILLIWSFLMMGLTGFRSRVFRLSMLTFFASICFSKHRAKTVLLWLLIGLAGVGFIALASTKLPLSIQRVLSDIPGVKVDATVARVAKLSGDWRFNMWKDYCIPNVPKHLLIGRGVVSDITSFSWLQSSWYGSAEFAYHMHAYHSGPFSLLLDFGLFGTVAFTLFFLLVIKDGWRTARRYASLRDDTISKYYIFLVVVMTYELFGYFFVFGSVPTALPRMLVEAAMLRILKKNFLMESPSVTGTQSIKPAQDALLKPFKSVKPVNNQWAKSGLR